MLSHSKASQFLMKQNVISQDSQSNNAAGNIKEVPPLSPRHSKSKSRPHLSTVTPHYCPSAMAKTLDKYQQTILGLAIVDLEIEMLLLREYSLEQARRRDRKRALEGGTVQLYRVEKSISWSKASEERVNFF